MTKAERYAKWRSSHLEQDRARSRAYYHANKEKRARAWQEYYSKNEELLKEASRLRRKSKSKEIAEYNRAYYLAHPEQMRERARVYRRGNPEKIRSAFTRYYLSRRSTDIQFKILTTLRNRLTKLVRENKGRTKELIGCTLPELLIHLENQFLPGMTWDNHGISGWHIDHILPVSSFDLMDPVQQRRCFHYTNLQPLWAADNIRKGARLG